MYLRHFFSTIVSIIAVATMNGSTPIIYGAANSSIATKQYILYSSTQIAANASAGAQSTVPGIIDVRAGSFSTPTPWYGALTLPGFILIVLIGVTLIILIILWRYYRKQPPAPDPVDSKMLKSLPPSFWKQIAPSNDPPAADVPVPAALKPFSKNHVNPVKILFSDEPHYFSAIDDLDPWRFRRPSDVNRRLGP